MLLASQKDVLMDWCISLSRCAGLFTYQEIRRKIFEMTNRKPSMKWVQWFLKKHPDLLAGRACTRGIERFSTKEIFGKILKVSHFYLGFSPDKNNKEIQHSQRV